MQHEIIQQLSVASGDFETAKTTKSTRGNWTVSFGPILTFALKLQESVEFIQAPDLTAKVWFEFIDFKGSRWADHELCKAIGKEFWATYIEYNDKKLPTMPDRKAWMASRAWFKTRLSTAQLYYPECFTTSTGEEIMQNIQMQRPSPAQRAFARLHDAFGYPRALRFTYETRLDIINTDTKCGTDL